MPGGPGGREVGRISIRVVPDLTEFRSKVAAIVKGLPDANVKVEADTGEAREEIADVTKDRKSKVKVDADTAGAEAKIDAAARNRTSKVKVDVDKVGLTPEVVTRFANDVRSRLDKVTGLNQVHLTPEIVDGRFLAQMKLRQLEQQIKLKPTLDHAAIEEMRLRLAHENFTAKVKMEMDRNNLERMASGAADAFDQKLDKIFARPHHINTGGGGGGFGGGGGGFGGFGGGGMGGISALTNQGIWVGAAVVGLLAPALSMLATALVALPALIAAVALPIGAIALGKDGLMKALENVGLVDTKKGKTPFDKDKHSAGVELKKLQDDVSSEFERGLTPIFRELVGLLPQVREGFTGIARGIVANIQGLADAITQGEGPAQLKNLMGNVGEMLNQMAPGLHSFASAILGLASKVSDHFPGLAKFFDEWGGKFDNWVKKISGDGTLDGAISGLRPVMDALMGFVGKLMDAGLKMMSTPDMAGNITKFIDALTNFAINTMPLLVRTFSELATIVDKISAAAGWLSGAGGPKTPLGPHKPGDPGDGKTVTGKDGLFPGVVRKPDGTVDAPIVDWWKNHHFPMPGDLTKHPLGTAGDGLINQGKHPFQMPGMAHKADGSVDAPILDAAQGANNLAGKGLQALGKGAYGSFNAVLEEARKLPQQLGAALAPVDKIVGETWDKVSKAGQEAWNGILKACQDMAHNVMSEIQKLPGQIQSELGKLAGIGATAGKALLDGLLKGMTDTWKGVQDFVGGIAGWIAEHKGPLDYDRTVLEPNGQALMDGLGSGIEQGLQGVLARARRIAGEVQGAMAGGFSPGSRSGAAQAAVEQAESMVGQSYVSGISDCSGAISQVYSAMTGKKTHFTTMADFAALGFKPGFKSGALNIGVTPLPGQSGHMAATLPNGENFESGGRLGGGPKVGGGAAGARDAQFSQHWYYDSGGGAIAGGADVAGMQGEIKQSLMELDVERDKLQAQRDALPKGKESKAERDSISEQLKQIKMARDALVTQRDELKLGASQVGAGAGGKGGKGDSMSEAASMITKALASMIDMAKGAVMAPLGELEHDLGIGGNGAIPKLAEFGLGWAQGELNNMIGGEFGQGNGKYSKSKDGDVHFHVGSVDEALQADQTLKNRQALQWKDR